MEFEKFDEKLREFTKSVKQELNVYLLVLQHKKTPWQAKILLGSAIACLLLPFDIIPDVVPAVGQLDDVVIVAILVILSLKMIPPKVINECRNRANK